MPEGANLPGNIVDVAIVGAGPYGLSIAAHLKACGVKLRIFGRPMQAWVEQMPKGMQLKSDGFASSLSEPDSVFTLAHYCKEQGIPYADGGLPVRIEVFSAYGLEFQRRYVPEVENKIVTSLRRLSDGFRVELQDGEVVAARQVVIAVGIRHFRYVPPVLAALPQELVTHSSEHSSLDRFQGKQVAVVGAGASALDLAALLDQAGAFVELVARKTTIRFHDPPGSVPRSLLQRLRAPKTGLGPGWKTFWCVNAPWVFRYLPEQFRVDTVRRMLSPAAGWFIKQDVVGKLPFNLGVAIEKAETKNGRISLELSNGDGARRTLVADHVIAATGYKTDLQRLAFLDPDLLAGIRSVDRSPMLSSNFEASVPGLYFVGMAAANTFGPLMCFVFGTRFVARRLSKHLAKSAQTDLVSNRAMMQSQELHAVNHEISQQEKKVASINGLHSECFEERSGF